MKKVTTSILLMGVLALSISITSCKKKPKDADIKAAIETALKADPTATGIMVDVKDGVATITGEFKDEASKAAAEKAVTAIKGVKSVINNSTVTPPVVIAPDDPLTKTVNDVLTAFPGVSATVKDGIISLAGEIKKADLQKLMMALQALKPKKVDPSALVKK